MKAFQQITIFYSNVLYYDYHTFVVHIEIMPVLSNYVRVGGDAFLSDPKRAEMIVSMCSAVSCSHAH